MNKFFRVVFVNDFSKGNRLLGDNSAVGAAAAGNDQLARLSMALTGVKDDIFLQSTLSPRNAAPRDSKT